MKRTVTKEELQRLYYDEELSLNEIARLYGVSRTTVIRWMNKHGIKRRNKREATKLFYRKHPEVKEKISEKARKSINLSPSKALAYILGVLLGDGCVYKDGHRGVIKLEVTDKVFAENFMRALKEIGLNPRSYIIQYKGRKKTYMVRAFSANFYDFYSSLSLEDIRKLVSGYELDFVRGFYESEGRARFKGNCLEVYIYNTRKELLTLIKELLANHGIRASIHKSGSEWALGIYGNNAWRFLLKIKPCIRNPICGGKLRNPEWHRVRCPRCGYETDRDVVACLNMLKMWGAEGPPTRPLMMLPDGGSERGKLNFSTPSA